MPPSLQRWRAYGTRSRLPRSVKVAITIIFPPSIAHFSYDLLHDITTLPRRLFAAGELYIFFDADRATIGISGEQEVCFQQAFAAARAISGHRRFCDDADAHILDDLHDDYLTIKRHA